MTARRRIAIGVALALFGLALAIVIVWQWWLPSAIRGRVEEAAARRGLSASVGVVEIGSSAIVLRDVELRDGSPAALQVRAAEVRADAGLWALASDGSAAIRALHGRDVDVRVNLESERLPRTIERLRGEGTDREESTRRRAVDVDGLSLVLTDRRGALFRVTHVRAALSPEDGTLGVSAGPVELTPEDVDGARAGRLEARLERTPGGWKIARGALAEVEIRYRERDGEDRSPLWARVRAHARRLSADGEDEPASDGDASSTTSSGAALFARARAVLGPRLARGARLQIEGLSVHASAGETQRTVLRDLEADVHVVEEGELQLTGSGRPGRGGRLGWRLTVHPDELRAEGRLDFQRLPFVLVLPLLPSLPFHQPEEARVSGELSIEGRGATRVHLDGEIAVDDLAFSSPRIAPHPVRRIAFGASGTADWDPITRRLEVASATITAGDARATLFGSLEWPDDHYLVDVTVALPPTDCDTAVGAIPADLLDEMGAFSFSGQIGARARAHIDSRDLDASTLDIRVADGCQFETAPALADVRRFQAPFTHRVVEPDGTIFEMETGPGTVNWTPIREMSPFFVQAVLGHEDGAFFQHQGFSTSSIRSALIRNLRAGRYVYGASTITMQLVKNVFLRREKTLARKAQEVLLTWWIESTMSKEQILELYLNVIEYGPGVYGVRNAADHYFGVSPDELGPAESAYLATILPNPKAYHSYWEQDEVPDRFRRRVARFLETLGSRNRYDAEAVANGLETLAHLDFHHPNEPRPPEQPHRGHATALPIGPSLDAQWQAEFGPEDPGFGPLEEEQDPEP